MTRRALLYLGLGLATLGGCAPPRYADDALFRADLAAPYRLASGDRLRILVFGEEQLTNSYNVDGSGQIAMPLIGAVRAQGMTTGQLSAAISARLKQGYLRDPKVSVEVEAYRPFYVLGEAAVPGQYPFVNGMTVQNAVAIAGGFTPRGAEDYVEITRVLDGQPVTAAAPLTFPVRPGDTINVRERFF